jgi:hypothetical protein
MKFRKPFRPKTRKITPARYWAIAEMVFITGSPLGLTAIKVGANYIDLNRIDGVCFVEDSRNLMAHGIQETSHVWLVMLKSMRALTRYAAAGIEETGLGDSDFRVLEALLRKGLCPSTR